MTFVPSVLRTIQRRKQPRKELPTKQYITHKHYTRGIEAARRYRGWVERKTTRAGDRGGGFTKFGRGAAMAPAGVIEYGSVVPIAIESAVRKPKETAQQAIPGLLSGFKGMASEAKKRPFEFGGEMIGQAALMYGLQRGISKIPVKGFKPKIPKGTPKGTPKGLVKGKSHLIQKGKPIQKVVPERAGSKIVTHPSQQGKPVYKPSSKQTGIIDRPLSPEMQKLMSKHITKETKVTIPKPKPKTHVKQPGVIDKPLTPEMQKLMSKHITKSKIVKKPTTKVTPKQSDIPFDKPLTHRTRRLTSKHITESKAAPKGKPKVVKPKPDVIDRPLTSKMRQKMLKDIPKEPKTKTPKIEKPPKSPDDIVLDKPLTPEMQKLMSKHFPKKAKTLTPKTKTKTPLPDKPLDVDVKQAILKQYEKSRKVGAERITHVSQRPKPGVEIKRAPSTTKQPGAPGKPPKYEYPTIHPEELPGKIGKGGKKTPQKIDIYERAVGKPKPTVSSGKIKQLEILVKEIKEELKVTPGKGRTQLKASLRNLERELKLGSGEYSEQAVRGQSQQQVLLVKTKPPVLGMKKITLKQIPKPKIKVGKTPKPLGKTSKSQMKTAFPIPIFTPPQTYKQEAKPKYVQKQEITPKQKYVQKHTQKHKQAHKQQKKQAKKQKQFFVQDLGRVQGQARQQKRKQTPKRKQKQLMKQTMTRPQILIQRQQLRAQITQKTKRKKKSEEEKLREFEEKAKEYDPEAWFERHKIATIEEMLGK